MPIYKDIQAYVNISSGEIDLFRGLMKAMKGIGFVDELHGTKHLAQFDNPLNTTQKISCEICDLLIFSYNGTQARFTFLQNKKNFAKSYKGINNISLPLRQRYLLGTFPLISMKNKEKHIPNDIFINRTLDSIGSLGVFYIDTSGQINMDYSIVSLMSTSGSFSAFDYEKNHNRTFSFTGVSNKIRLINSYEEVEACVDLNQFETNLMNMKIGEPISNLDKTYADYIISSIESVLGKEINDNTENIISDLKKIRKEHNIESREVNKHGIPVFHVAIINTKQK
jgi:hypothetical protein